MPSLLDHEISALVRSLPVERHGFRLSRNQWVDRLNPLKQGGLENCLELVESIFDRNDEIMITRGMLLGENFGSPAQKCAAILLWGYSKNERGRVTKLLPSLNPIVKHAASNSPWLEYFGRLNEIKDLGFSTITKFAYFFKCTFDGHPALILDRQVNIALCHWEQTQHLHQKPKNFSGKYYLCYLKQMEELSCKIGCRPDQLEMFLFNFGRNLT
jgi:hypothetical protein